MSEYDRRDLCGADDEETGKQQRQGKRDDREAYVSGTMPGEGILDHLPGNHAGDGPRQDPFSLHSGDGPKQDPFSWHPGDGLLQDSSGAAEYLRNADRAKTRPYIDPRIPSGGGHTEEEYFALPEDLRVELIEGVFYAMAAPAKLHQGADLEIARQLADCIEKNACPCYLYIAPSDVALGEDRQTIVQPDVYVHCDRSREKPTGPHRGAPDFVVEILSPSNPENDLWRKRKLYRKHKVREYWIVDPGRGIIYVFLFEKNPSPDAPPAEYTFSDTVPVEISGGACRVDFRKVLGKIRHLLEEDDGAM